jgi:hypothetical protein
MKESWKKEVSDVSDKAWKFVRICEKKFTGTV